MGSLQGRLLLAVGLLVVVAVSVAALALRRDTRREFLRFQDSDRRAVAERQAPLVAQAVATLDGVCCGVPSLRAAGALLPPQLLFVVFDAQGSAVASGGGAAASITDLHAQARGGVFEIEATRGSARQREQITLQVPSRGHALRLADGRPATLHVVPVPDPERAARVDVFLGSLDRRMLLLTLTVGAFALIATVVVARSTVRPLQELRAATASLAVGAFDQRVRVAGPREVAALAADFNTLARRLQEQHALRQALTHDVAHELRTPLTALQCRLESVIDGVAGDPVGTCRALSQDVHHLSQLVDDLQDLAQAEAGQLRLHLEAVPLRATVGGVLATLGLAAASRVTVDVSETVAVTADAGRLRQVLLNLLGNAQRHAPSDAAIAVRARVEGQQVAIDVENAGSSIPDVHLPHVFDRFTRVDPARQRKTGGSGLGLAIVKHLIEAQGGSVTAASGPDGVMMRVTLPTAQALVAARPAAAAPVGPE